MDFRPKRDRVLIISQVFPPDPAAVGQYLAEVADELARRGNEVSVLTARRGQDDPSEIYPAQEQRDNIRIRRTLWSAFGKARMAARLAAGVVYLVQTLVYGLTRRRLDAVLVSTAPPLASVTGVIIARLKRARLTYWVMDLNPDQLAVLGIVDESSAIYRLLHRLNGWSLRAADTVIVLDEFMHQRLVTRYGVRGAMVVPLWALQQGLQAESRAENSYRARYGVLPDQILIMYSGNHSPYTPLTPMVDAAGRFSDSDRLQFWFVGGGAGKADVEQTVAEQRLENVRCLPYQPLEQLGSLLSAADIHVVAMNEALIGINHPSKIYGVMAAGKPVLYLGPKDGHISTILEQHDIGWRVDPNKPDEIDAVIEIISGMSRQELNQLGERAARAERADFNRDALLRKFATTMLENI